MANFIRKIHKFPLQKFMEHVPFNLKYYSHSLPPAMFAPYGERLDVHWTPFLKDFLYFVHVICFLTRSCQKSFA